MQVLHNRRVLLLTEEYPPVIGGIQNYLSELMERLSSEHVVVITQKQDNSEIWDKKQKYKIIRVNMRGFSIPRWRAAGNILEETVKKFKPEIIVCGKALFEGRAAMKIWNKYNIPYVVMTYGMEINTWLKHRKTKQDLLNVCEQAARVFVINEETKTVLDNFLRLPSLAHRKRWSMARKDGVDVENEVDMNKFVKMYPGVNDFYGLGSDRVGAIHELPLRVVTVCRLVSRKGVDVVINAVNEIRKTIPNIEYLIIGEGPEKQKLEELVTNLGLQANVKFLGKLSNEQIRDVFRRSDLFVMTPRNEEGNMEGFGIVYLEAALSGLCSVGSRSGGVSEAVHDGETGLLAGENDVADTAAKIRTLLTDEQLRKRLAENARIRAVNDFSWEKRAILFRGVIESVILARK